MLAAGFPETGEFVHLKNLGKLKRRGHRLENVIAIDDSPEKLGRHYGNLLPVSPFIGDLSDTELRDVQPFLLYLAEQENVRRIEKRGWRSFGSRTASRLSIAGGGPPPPSDHRED